jgi:glycosyltransferase involved in cell wall biosynthesis
VAILEAMAYGLPVISTIHSGIPEAVQDHKTGFLVEEGNVDLMADRLVKFAKDSVLREEYGRNGRLVAENKFSWEIEKSKLLEVMGF